MTIIWVDWVNGLDTNAGTNPALPKKTIASATTGRTGGDEIRVAKSPDPTRKSWRGCGTRIRSCTNGVQ